METLQRFPGKGNTGKGKAPHEIRQDFENAWPEDQVVLPENARATSEAQASLAAKRAIAWLDPVIQSALPRGSELAERISQRIRELDPSLGAYQERVASLSRAMGQRLNFSQERIEDIVLAARLLGLGRVGLPAEGDNPALFRLYPRIGFEVLKEVGLPRAVALIVLQHRELNDGKGFPAGLEANEIPLDAHILGVAAAVVDRLAPAGGQGSASLQEVLADLAEHRHVQYRPAAVDACVRVFRETGFTLDA